MSHPWHGILFDNLVGCSLFTDLLQKASQVVIYAMSHPWRGIGQVHCPDFKTVPYLTFHHIRPVKLWGLFQIIIARALRDIGLLLHMIIIALRSWDCLYSCKYCWLRENSLGVDPQRGTATKRAPLCLPFVSFRQNHHSSRMNDADSVPYYKDYTVSIF